MPPLPASFRRHAAAFLAAGVLAPVSFPLIDGAGAVAQAQTESLVLAQSYEPQPVWKEPEFNDNVQGGPALGVRPNKNCDFRENTPRPVDTSEDPGPDGEKPTPLPVASPTPGGSRMSECGDVLPEGFKVPQETSASAWAIVDLDSGDVIAARDPHGRFRPASTIKVLLALVALEQLPLDRKVTVSEEAAATEGSAAGIGPNGKYTVKELLYGLLLNSGNDCAAALVDELGGKDKARELVNAKAKQLGATDTRVVNVSGLDGPGMSSSAYDLSLFYKTAFNNEEFARIVKTPSVKFPGWGTNEGYDLYTDNGLMGSYDGAIGGKTGFTDSARHTFYGAAERDGRRLGVIILDTTIFHGRAYQQAARFLDAGFATPQGNKVGTLELDYNNGSSNATLSAAGPGGPGGAGNFGQFNGMEKAAPWALLLGVVIVVAAGARRSIRRSRRQ